MAEVTGMRANALPYPVYGAPWTVVIPIFDADGDLVTGAAGLDSEISKNGDTFADCTNEATEIATSSGMYYLTLTGTEMTADIVSVIVKTSTSGAKTTPITLYPRKLVSLVSGTSQGGAVGYITLAAATVAFDGQFAGCLCLATIDGTVEARILQTSTASNQQCTVTPNWNTAPDTDDTYTIYLPEGRQIETANSTHLAGVVPGSATIGTATNLTNAPTNGDLTATMKASVTTAASSATPSVTVSDKTGFSLSTAGIKAIWDQLTSALTTAGSIGKLLVDNINATISSRSTLTQAQVTGGAYDMTNASVTVRANLVSILGTALTETAGQIAAGFKKFFDVASPVSTMDAITLVTNLGNDPSGVTTLLSRILGTLDAGTHKPQTGDLYSKVTTMLQSDGLGNWLFTSGALVNAPTGGSAPSAAAVADAVWDEVLSGHSTAGTAGKALTDAGSAGDPWSTALPGAYGAGTAGNILGNRLVGTIASGTHNPQTGDAYARLGAPAGASISADVAAVKAQTAAIEIDTQDLQTQVGTDGAGLTNMPWNPSWDAEVQSECADAITAAEPIDADLKKINGVTIVGNGVSPKFGV